MRPDGLSGEIIRHAVSLPGGFVLESLRGATHSRYGPYSWAGGATLFGWGPTAALCVDEDIGHADPFDAIDAFLGPLDLGRAAIAVGYLSYDLGGVVEPTARSRHEAEGPLLHLALYDAYYRHDPATGMTARVDADGRETAIDDAAVLLPPGGPAGGGTADGIAAEAQADFTARAYMDAVRAAREYILDGDIFEVNLSQRFRMRCDAPAARLYARLRAANPAPYCAFLSCPGVSILSSSPEMFLRVEEGRVTTRPIKGTARRAGTDEADAAAAGALAASVKDNAELAMVIDLERNDLGRVCRYGSVRVRERARVETFEKVHHLVSTVEGELSPGVGLGGLLRATFPGGSITGAPKVRAMQIIDELEPCRRGVYTGSVGYALPGGRSEWNIAIRTIVKRGDELSLHVGGAVTADSRPEAEYEETLLKAEGVLAALGMTRGAGGAFIATEAGG